MTRAYLGLLLSLCCTTACGQYPMYSAFPQAPVPWAYPQVPAADLSWVLALRPLWIRGHSLRKHELAAAQSALAILRRAIRPGLPATSPSRGASNLRRNQAPALSPEVGRCWRAFGKCPSVPSVVLLLRLYFDRPLKRAILPSRFSPPMLGRQFL